MQTVSQAWKDEQEKTLVEAESFVDLMLIVGDPAAKADASASDNGHVLISNTGQIVENAQISPVRYATLEGNLWILGGTFSILPDHPPYGDNGYVGDGLSGVDGTYTTIPTVTISFSKVYQTVIPGITITWGSAYEEEYADTYRVSWYSGETQVGTKTVEGNTDLTSLFLEDIQGYDKIKLEILRWNKPSRRARIERIVVGIERSYQKKDLFKYTHSMFVDPVSAELPKAEITFEVANLNGEYNPENPAGSNKYLMERQTVQARYGYRLGDSVEWIKAGTFFLSEWDCPQNGITATFTARDGLEYMTDPYTGPSSGALAEIALSAFQQTGLPSLSDGNNPWTIHSSLSGIQAASGADLSANTIAEVLQYVANAGCCVFYQDRDGRFHIEPLPSGTTDYSIDQFNSYSNAEISLTKQLKAVNVNDGAYLLSVGPVGEIQNVNNPLISAERAQTVAQWVANYLKERKIFSGSFRADPRLDALDRVTNENQFSESVVLVTQIEYTYNGAFRGTYEGRSGV